MYGVQTPFLRNLKDGQEGCFYWLSLSSPISKESDGKGNMIQASKGKTDMRSGSDMERLRDGPGGHSIHGCLAASVPAKPTNPFPAAAGLKMPSGLGLGLALLVCLA